MVSPKCVPPSAFRVVPSIDNKFLDGGEKVRSRDSGVTPRAGYEYVRISIEAKLDSLFPVLVNLIRPALGHVYMSAFQMSLNWSCLNRSCRYWTAYIYVRSSIEAELNQPLPAWTGLNTRLSWKTKGFRGVRQGQSPTSPRTPQTPHLGRFSIFGDWWLDFRRLQPTLSNAPATSTFSYRMASARLSRGVESF